MKKSFVIFLILSTAWLFADFMANIDRRAANRIFIGDRIWWYEHEVSLYRREYGEDSDELKSYLKHNKYPKLSLVEKLEGYVLSRIKMDYARGERELRYIKQGKD